MSDKSKIEWCDSSWNPITGCTKVSEGCRNCYAMTFAERWRGTPGHYFENGFDITLRPDKLDKPLKWKRPRKIFVNSMSDLFHESVPDEFISKVFAVMSLAKQHTFQLLTKRPERMLAFLSHENTPADIHYFRDLMLDDEASAYKGSYERWNQQEFHSGAMVETLFGYEPAPEWPLPNVWLGTSVENQKAADDRIPLLLQTPAAVRFLSCEPLLGEVSLYNVPGTYQIEHPNNEGYGVFATEGIDWVIVGGESGPKARPMHPEWARDIRDQCQVAGTAFFFKQWGEWLPVHPDREPWEYNSPPSKCAEINSTRFYRIGKHIAGRKLDGREWNEFPEVKRHSDI